ncbi:hypothetical protein [Ferrimonas gelatinilytica]|uniref:DUF805 domain-containing protein n=1 Tax=Ferrimonas gelatinilytica TaxID=1255257 RepID=A0ABP9RYS0_9GAMM
MQTLLCLRGRDLPVRTLLIQAFSVMLIFITAGLFYGLDAQPVAVSLMALLMAGVGYCAARRRLNDAGYQLALAVASPVTWFIFALTQWGSTGASWSFGLLLLPSAVALGLALLPRKPAPTGHHGKMGYRGPALSRDATLPPRRVEPSLDGRPPAVISKPLAQESESLEFSSYREDRETGGESLSHLGSALLKRWPQQMPPWLRHRSIQLAAVMLLVLMIVWGLWPSKSQVEIAAQTEHAQMAMPQGGQVPEFQHGVEMPDTYELLLNNEGVILRWPGDPEETGLYWSLLTAKGDRQCRSAKFNSGSEYRPVKVEVWGEDNYYAFFSPLDTHRFLYDVAMRGSFQLCGYDFSLSGSMDILRANPAFAPYTRNPG